MVRIQIGDSERELGSASESWINQHIKRRKAAGTPVCIRVIIREDRVNMTLSTSHCHNVSGGGRPPNRCEQEIFDLWEKRGMNEDDFHGGHVISFLKQLMGRIS